MATITFTPSMLYGAGTRGVPLIPKSGGGGGDTGLATVSNAFSMTFISADNTVMDVGELPPYFKVNPIGTAKDNPWSVSLWVSGSGGSFFGLPYAALSSTLARSFGFNYSSGYLSFGGKFAGARFRETSYATSTAYDESIFNHIVVTYDGNDLGATDPSSYKLYVNGSDVPVSYQAPNPNDFRTEGIAIGASGTGTSVVVGWDGQVDEVGIFTASLDAPIVESIYSASLPLGSGVTGDLTKLSTPPIAWYRMGD